MAEIIYAGDGGLFKSCTKCDEILPINSFSRSRGAPLDRRTYCRVCGEISRKIWEEKNPDYAAEWYLRNKETADATSMKWQRDNPDKVRESYRKWRAANIDQETERCRKYRDENRDKISQRDAAIRAKNPEKRKQYWDSWYARFGKERLARLREDPKHRVDKAISHGIWRALKGEKSGAPWENLVGYTLDDLMAHLEDQFLPGMTWENYGKSGWEVDHKIPRAAFNYTSSEHADFKACWALDNLSPLWKRENQSKGAKLTGPFQPSLAL